ncbi:MAG: hypothetical protein COY38_01550 [Candidatus Aenigmarchaeota archaeon CG_4_10_14_0_8_um_filter_37_24]|nr:hypothetical protein [Candidatus Aenigmarchaeota archaeon]OIN87379.1 MAG: hypothetical protein AUJ50_02690 [Candidatus Aenigmarchaeota archaeon CG1_02_38_14]PIV68577.1 MAG: hypothetical protein COS07_03650 [Candidatus Aenigmarchaeota archaeon CG01_land_8_20_14_3_00_37_9]PIW41668.1 MAG: hypothetical protein COW21_00725 [Candidatus Aenigmarchaeota archaeon CG15_BIG_FIL_POST_REV_8_21_14_020_37_27]PIX50447.1 MAG: hypothetical protein COZ52_04120 [Candidatus Aenigmarchaeota archaeon CG_4_8_14_3_u
MPSYPICMDHNCGSSCEYRVLFSGTKTTGIMRFRCPYDGRVVRALKGVTERIPESRGWSSAPYTDVKRARHGNIGAKRQLTRFYHGLELTAQMNGIAID